MEGREYMGLPRNIKEDFILKSMAENSTKVPMPNIEMAGFKSHFQTFRTDSEELFKSWITSGDSHNFNTSSLLHCTPKAMGRMAREPDYVTPVDEENSGNLDQNSFRNVVERGVPYSIPHSDKAWFHSSRPMTRSRSSELKESLMYAASPLFPERFPTDEFVTHKRNLASLQNFETIVGTETMHDVSGSNINTPKHENENQNGLCEASLGNILNQMGTYVFPHSSMCNFNDQRDIEDGSLEVYGVQEVLGDTSLIQNGQITNDHNRVLRAFDGHTTLGFEGFDPVDGLMANTCESSVQVNRMNKENGTNAPSMDYLIITDDQKPKERLARYGSLTSSDPVDEGEVTKKRRVERSRKMAEAKERILTPNFPSDMQSIMKRCKSLEKEVRSLKLNLAFMNRKDSEQIKQLEELQIQHEELTEEKERLLEEIERILIARRNM